MNRQTNIFGKLGNPIIIAFIVVGAALIGLVWYDYSLSQRIEASVDALNARIQGMQDSLAQATTSLGTAILNTHNALSNAIDEERQNVGSLNSKLGNYQNQFQNVSTTVSTLQKLSSLDKELLEKYSKVFFLNEHYAPAELSAIPDQYKYSDNKPLQVIPQVLPRLEAMIDAASKDGVTIYVASAYRSFDEQSGLKAEYKVTYGAGTANQFSADQGYSEHQLGTTVDLITPGLGGTLDDRFAGTPAYAWLNANAYRYGFVISYPKSNPYYVFEPWHWRFVGVKLATDLHNKGIYFYDMDQRDIDAYLVSIFD